jgi:hypothetical protein
MKKDEQTGWLRVFSPFLWGGSDYTYPLPQVKVSFSLTVRVSFSLNNDIAFLRKAGFSQDRLSGPRRRRSRHPKPGLIGL